jgi:hypothetical protein
MSIESNELKAGDQSQGQETVHETGGYEAFVDLCSSSHLDAEGHFKDTDINYQVMGIPPIEDRGEDKYFVADSENEMQYSA